MAYYTILQNAWTSVTQPPAGVIGTGLTSTMTTDQKLTSVNGWVVAGTIPVSFFTNGAALLNSINWPEFNAIATASLQTQLIALCNNPGPILGGSGNTTNFAPGIFLAAFTTGSKTIASLTALAKSTITPWWQSNGYPSPFNQADTTLAGLT
jgi:hypothetical protein